MPSPPLLAISTADEVSPPPPYLECKHRIRRHQFKARLLISNFPASGSPTVLRGV